MKLSRQALSAVAARTFWSVVLPVAATRSSPSRRYVTAGVTAGAVKD
jgi:hypothetical protein